MQSESRQQSLDEELQAMSALANADEYLSRWPSALPQVVEDGSGDPENQFFVEPPAAGAVGKRYVVFRGTFPGIYNDWSIANEYTTGIKYNCHRSFGTPREAWLMYENRRRVNFVQKLPYVAPARSAPLRLETPNRRQTVSRVLVPSPRTSNQTTYSTSAANSSRAPHSQQHPSPNISAPSTPSRRSRHQSDAPLHVARPSSSRLQTTSPHQDPQPRHTPSLSPHASFRAATTGAPRSRSPRLIGEVFEVTASSARDHQMAECSDPWDGEAEAFVVFQGSLPGLYFSWRECRNATVNTVGPVYAGYPTEAEATAAYRRAIAAQLLKVLPVVVLDVYVEGD